MSGQTLIMLFGCNHALNGAADRVNHVGAAVSMFLQTKEGSHPNGGQNLKEMLDFVVRACYCLS